jgi:hypothetical protein
MSEHTRRTKRFNREHRKRSRFGKAVEFIQHVVGRSKHFGEQPPAPPGEWRFHKDQWGDLQVLVMPKSCKDGIVRDSNTGVVVEAPYHKSLLAHVVVKDGRRVDCDEPALNHMVTGNHSKPWHEIPGYHAYAVPRYRVRPEERNAAWLQAIEAMITGQGMSREQASAECDQILGWGPDSISCTDCSVTIHGRGIYDVAAQAREYGWVFAYDDGQTPRPICPSCAEDYRSTPPAFKIRPIPSDEELAQMERDS